MLEPDVALIENILVSRGFRILKEEGFGEVPARVFVRLNRLDAVKRVLKSYRIQTVTGEKVPIPW